MDAEYSKHSPAFHISSAQNGYVKIKRPDLKWQLEHHYVMEQHIGRAIYPHENVHHKNGQRADNRLENLELWSTHQPTGQRVADKLAWCDLVQSAVRRSANSVIRLVCHPI